MILDGQLKKFTKNKMGFSNSREIEIIVHMYTSLKGPSLQNELAL